MLKVSFSAEQMKTQSCKLLQFKNHMNIITKHLRFYEILFILGFLLTMIFYLNT
jgi:hypothetical protein